MGSAPSLLRVTCLRNCNAERKLTRLQHTECSSTRDELPAMGAIGDRLRLRTPPYSQDLFLWLPPRPTCFEREAGALGLPTFPSHRNRIIWESRSDGSPMPGMVAPVDLISRGRVRVRFVPINRGLTPSLLYTSWFFRCSTTQGTTKTIRRGRNCPERAEQLSPG